MCRQLRGRHPQGSHRHTEEKRHVKEQPYMGQDVLGSRRGAGSEAGEATWALEEGDT